tara:strand:- start:530 stop:1336 length:807 start_codon:yes stop_codon:yes gene_type:complete
MRKFTLFILLIISTNIYCQKRIEISENIISKRFYENLDSLNYKYDLKDLRDSNELAIRIWKDNEVILLEENSKYIFKTSNGLKDIIEKKNFENKINNDSLYKVFETNSGFDKKNEHHYIDAFPTTIELNSPESYRIISYYKNEKLEEIIQNIRKENSINELRKEIVDNLPAGSYRMGMTSLKIDYLPKEDKSNFYKKLEPEISAKLKVSEKTNPIEMPLIIINNEPHYFEDLNNLSLSDVKDYEIINDNRKFLYGTRGKFGIIKVNTY